MHSKRTLLGALLGVIILSVLLPAAACAIPRETVLARGKVWVDRHVAYSQTRWASVEGTLVATKVKNPQYVGYRTDCSGFVSMCLGLVDSAKRPMSLTTRTFSPGTVTMIKKDELLPGDVMLLAGTHIVLFVGWSDDAHTSFTSYEERGTKYGTVKTTRVYADMIKWGYHPYRYKAIDDLYADVETSVYGSDHYKTAAKASAFAFPPPKTTAGALVIANGDQWTGNVAASSLATACGGPLLLTNVNSIPASTTAEIKRLKPSRVYVIGGRSKVSTGVVEKIKKLGPKVTRIDAGTRYELSVAVSKQALSLLRADKHTIDTAYMVGTDASADAAAVAAVSAHSGRPIYLGQQSTATKTTLSGLKAAGIKKVVLIGSKSVLGSGVVAELKKQHISVTRVAGTDRYRTALAVARHGVALGGGLSWSHVGVASGTSPHTLLACAVAQGLDGSVLVYTPSTSLQSDVKAEIKAHASKVGKARIFGSVNDVGLGPRASIAKLLRAAK